MKHPPHQPFPQKLISAIEDLSPKACSLSDHLASHPEPSGMEYQACSLHVQFLQSQGFDTKIGVCGFDTSFFSKRNWGSGNPVVTLLAEYDALSGIGHGCGHNMGGAMTSLAAAAIARSNESENVELRVLGTPCEEIGDAKVVMADHGVFNDTDIALMIHPAPGFSTVSFRSAACSLREVTFSDSVTMPGASGNGIPPAEALERLRADLLSLQDKSCPATVSPICFEDRPESFLSPGSAKGRFAFFSARRDFLENFLEKARGKGEEEAIRSGLSVSWTVLGADLSEFLPNRPAESHMLKIFDKLGISVNPSPMLHGSADIGNVSHVCPVLHPMLDVTGEKLPWHSKEFALATTLPKAHEALVLGAAALCLFINDFVTDKSLRKTILEAHSARLHEAPF